MKNRNLLISSVVVLAICGCCLLFGVVGSLSDNNEISVAPTRTPIPTIAVAEENPIPTPEPPTPVPPTPVPPTPVPPTESAMSIIPEDVTYSIINEDIISGIKRSLDVQINKRVSEDALQSIAMELKNSDPDVYERTFITYYLPETFGEEVWAYSNFNPDLEMQILGLTAKEVQELTEVAEDTSREIIGRWLNDKPYVGNVTTIFFEEGKFYLEEKYGDGSIGIRELIEEASSEGKKFIDKDCCGYGEFYLIDEQGNLQLWDDEGRFYTAQKTP